MDVTIRKTLIILVAILAAEAVPFALMLNASTHVGLMRLFGFTPQLWQPAVWPAWIVAAAVAIAYVRYAARSIPVVKERLFELHWLKLVTIPFALVTGTMEEVWFRRLLMDWAQNHGSGVVLQVLLSAAIFGIGHGVWGLFGRQWRIAVGATLATGVLGALLGVVYLLAGRLAAPCIWSHMLINLFIEPWLILAACSAGAAGWRRQRLG